LWSLPLILFPVWPIISIVNYSKCQLNASGIQVSCGAGVLPEMIRQFIRAVLKVLASLMLVTQMTACGPGGENNGASSDESDVVIGGSVGDGPITGATVTTYNARGIELASVISDIYATYRSTIKFKGREYPLRMQVSGGIDLVTGTAPDFKLYSVAISRKEKSVNINPFTTMAVIMARLMQGGVNADNIDAAMGHVTSQLGFGLDLNVISDPRITSINDDNVANIVKASEAMGEMIRRTRDVVTSTGTVVTGDDVMDAIAADMVDGFLDGAGATGTSPSISAVANVVSGQVLVEALSNNLKVGGVIATDLIDQAIMLTRLNINSDQMTGSVRITEGMLQQTRVALAAARVLDSSDQIIAIGNSLDGISANSMSGDVADELPPDTSESLDEAVIRSATATDEEMVAVNQVVHTGGSGSSGSADSGGTDTSDGGSTGSGDGGSTGGSSGGGTSDPVNTPPVISGTPAGNVDANTDYLFQPTASDADGDNLVFSISGKPGWASFNSNTGRISGTAANSDAGDYKEIVIAVTDGADTTALPAFSIRVESVNTPPVISGSPAGSVQADAGYLFQPTGADADGDNLTFSRGCGWR
jgi:hypothetical protein